MKTRSDKTRVGHRVVVTVLLCAACSGGGGHKTERDAVSDGATPPARVSDAAASDAAIHDGATPPGHDADAATTDASSGRDRSLDPDGGGDAGGPADAGDAGGPPDAGEPMPVPSAWLPIGPAALYVAESGNDDNPGTADAPLREVNRAASVATAGTVVHVGAGTYGPVTSTHGGTADARIHFVSDVPHAARIDGSGETTAWTNTAEYVTIQQFEITGADYNGILTTASHGRFLGNYIHDLAAPTCERGGAGIVTENYSGTHNDTIGNRIGNIVAPGDCGLIHGIYYQSPEGGRILDNIVYRTSGWGIHLWHNANTITISNNTVFANTQGGIVVGGSLEGNDQPPGIASGIVVTNNLVIDNGYYGIRELGRVGPNTYGSNLIYGNDSGDYSLLSDSEPTATVSADPQLVDYRADGTGDYRLQATSPAIDSGTTDGAAEYDFELSPRPKGGGIDLGAYESW